MGSVSSDDSQIGAPQEAINEFWENLITKKPAKRKPGTITGKNAAESYLTAANECRARVKRIVKECHRTNEKFTDPDFDIEDLVDKNCLRGLRSWYDDEPVATTSTVSPSRLGSALSTLVQSDILLQNAAAIDFAAAVKLLQSNRFKDEDGPGSVHRVDYIFEAPQFEIDGFSSSDVVQGSNGDCWFIAAVASICSNPKLIDKVCVERDTECGVYGFVFYRDGEWIWTVVDDNLYVRYKDFDTFGDRYDPTGVKEARYRKHNQTGSTALYFGSCAEENETWLPLLEKAYAKVHGDYDAISGGWSGEAVEDLTGGVTTKILTDRILSKERLWKELLQVNQQFLFSASSPGSYGDDSDARRGLALSHAYSVLKAVDAEDEDGKKHRLVLIRNPWGKRANAAMGEWTGPWSDGSAEWTPYWLEKLGHKFGDDGLFWMTYVDMLKRFDLLDRTRLFDQDWTVVQHWTSVSVAWVTGYLNTKFLVEIKRAGPTVFVLCQLDDRYFRGLEGKYDFDLHFILQEKDTPAGDHIVRARGAWFGNRSISAEVDLEAGIYEVLPKIEASRDADAPDVHEIVTKLAERNPQKLRQIGLNYDIANARGVVVQSDEEKKKHDEKQKKAADKKKKEKEAEQKEKDDFEAWKKDEKAEYEAWKREKKERDEREKRRAGPAKEPKMDNAKTEVKEENVEEEVIDTEATTADDPFAGLSKSQKKKFEKKMRADARDREAEDAKLEAEADTTVVASAAEETKPEVVIDLTIRSKDFESKEDPEDSTDPRVQIDAASNKDEDHDIPNNDVLPPSRFPRPPQSVAPGIVQYRPGHDDPQSRRGSVHGEEGPLPQAVPRTAVREEPKTWNAVCVIGLRVYSQDSEVSIKLVKPKDVEEGAMLDVDGETAAGATM